MIYRFSLNNEAEQENGSALMVALFVSLILSLLALGLLGRTLLVTQICGAERWGIRAFYAADAGLNMAQIRAKVQGLDAFSFSLPIGNDMGYGVSATTQEDIIDIEVDALRPAGHPRMVQGSAANAGQGADASLIIQSYRTTARSRHRATNSRREITEVFGVGPMPARLTD